MHAPRRQVPVAQGGGRLGWEGIGVEQLLDGFPAVHGLELLLSESCDHVDIVRSIL